MNILVCGARGFVGAALCERLEQRGHRVVKGVRHAVSCGELEIDYERDLDAQQWEARLQGVDAVINAVGILVEGSPQAFDRIHTRAPVALFDACCRVGIGRVIQISALGAQVASTPYFRSKLAADEYLQSLPISACVVRPALVYGATGTSAGFFRMLASLPVHALPAGGQQRLRPVHVDELAELVERLLYERSEHCRVIDVVGGEEVAYREMLSIYRRSMGFGAALPVRIPGWLIGMGAALFDGVRGSMLTRDTWRMLQQGSTSDATAMAASLGRQPRSLRHFIGGDASALRQQALAAWQTVLLRGALAFVWIWTALACMFFYPHEKSLALLAQAHFGGISAVVVFYLAVITDLALGVLTLIRPGRCLWLIQGVVVATYTAIISISMPASWWEPFGPVLKNLPILAILLILFSGDDKP